MINNFKQFINEGFSKGDLVRLKNNIDKDESDGDYGYSVKSGEVGEIRYLVSSTKDESEENKVYMVKFPGKRFVQLTQMGFSKVN